MAVSIIRLLKDYIMTPLLDVLYPPLCHHCDTLLTGKWRIICQNCWQQIPSFKGVLDQSRLGLHQRS